MRIPAIRRTFALIVMLIVPLCASAANPYTAARQLDKPDLQLMGCPKGATWDPRNGGECWTCGSGAARSVGPIDGPKACLTSPVDQLSGATMHEQDKTSCTGAGAYLDPVTASCWVCPNGSKPDRLQPAGSSKACFKRIPKQRRKATFVYDTGSILKKCRKGTFANVGSTRCHKCEKGWRHDGAMPVQTNGVCYKPPGKQLFASTRKKGFSLKCATGGYDPIRGGSCWSCPTGFIRNIAIAVDKPGACIKVAVPKHQRAKFLARKTFDAKQLARGAVSLGCKNQDPKAFFDPIGLGSCWRCPNSHPKRSLFPVNGKQACMRNACGGEGERPCLVWERIPSCDSGLVEDFLDNRCRQPTNLACTAYVGAMSAMRTAITKANDVAGKAQDAALDRVPGKEAMMAALENTMGHVQKQAEQLTSRVDVSAITDPFQNLVLQEPEFMQRMGHTLRVAAYEVDAIKAIFSDAKLLCSGDTARLAWRLEQLGLAELLKPPQRSVISLGQRSDALGARPFSLLGAVAGVPPLFANRDSFIKPHHRLVLDATASFPVSGTIKGLAPSATASLGLQIATNFKDDHGVYFTHGVTLAAELPGAKKKKNFVDTTDYFGGIDFSLGYQYTGPRPDSCPAKGAYAWGIPIKLGNLVGVGLNTCPHVWTGFTVTFASLKHGQNRELKEMVDLLVTTNAAGKPMLVNKGTYGPVNTPTGKKGWHLKLPEPKLQLGGGFEGALAIKGGRGAIF